MAFSEERESKITEYSEGVEEWNTVVRPAFGNLTITAYRFSSSTGQGSTIYTQPLEPVEHETSVITEKLDHDEYGALPDYKPLYFIGHSDPAIFGLDSVSHVNLTQSVNLALHVVSDDAQTWEILLPPMNLFERRI
jgi:hypothetical protein